MTEFLITDVYPEGCEFQKILVVAECDAPADELTDNDLAAIGVYEVWVPVHTPREVLGARAVSAVLLEMGIDNVLDFKFFAHNEAGVPIDIDWVSALKPISP